MITAQLGNQQTAVNLRMQQMTASVQLIEALGGWSAKANAVVGLALGYRLVSSQSYDDRLAAFERRIAGRKSGTS